MDTGPLSPEQKYNTLLKSTPQKQLCCTRLLALPLTPAARLSQWVYLKRSTAGECLAGVDGSLETASTGHQAGRRGPTCPGRQHSDAQVRTPYPLHRQAAPAARFKPLAPPPGTGVTPRISTPPLPARVHAYLDLPGLFLAVPGPRVAS